MMISFGAAGRAVLAVVVLAVLPAACLAAPVPRRPASPSAPPNARTTRISVSDISGEPRYQLLLQAMDFEPGAGVAPHVHPGDKTVRIEEDELTFIIGDDPPKVYREGDVVRIPAGAAHAAYNLSDEPAEALEILVVRKGQPVSTRVSAHAGLRRRRSAYRPAEEAGDGNFTRDDGRWMEALQGAK